MQNGQQQREPRPDGERDVAGYGAFVVGVLAGLTANYLYDNDVKQVPLFDGIRTTPRPGTR